MRLIIPLRDVELLKVQYTKFSYLQKYVGSIVFVYTTGRIDPEWKKKFEFLRIDCWPYRNLKILRFLKNYLKIKKHLRSLNADLVFGQSTHIFQCKLLSKMIDKPFVIRMIGSPWECRKANHINRIFRKILDIITDYELQKATLLIPMSKYVQLELQKRKKNFVVCEPVLNGVDLNQFKPEPKKKKKKLVLGYIGRLSNEKRVEVYLNIVDLFRNEFEFVMVGSNQAGFKIPANVKYYGFIPQKNLNNFYNQLDLLIFPSRTEGWGNVILEAYACNIPVLVSEEAMPRELEVFGYVANVFDFAKIVGELTDITLTEKGKGARSYAKNFSWDIYGRSMKNALIKALEIEGKTQGGI